MWYRNPVFIPLVLLLTLSACHRNTGEGQVRDHRGNMTVISGKLESGGGMEVLLEEMDAREYVPVDTVLCDDQGRFHIEFQPDRETFYALRTGNRGYLTLLIRPGQHLTVTGTPDQPLSYSVEGSPGSELLTSLAREHRKTLEELAAVARRTAALAGTDGFADEKAVLDRQFDSITHAFRDYSLGFIRENSESLAILIALHNMYGQGLPVFHPVEDREVYALVDSLLYPRYAGLEAVDLLHTGIAATRAAEQDAPAVKGPGVGEIAPDFVSSMPDGGSVALTDFRGKHVLLAFWAGWSSPSREENQVLRQAREAYGEDQLTILQVSFDQDRETWLRAIREDGLDWNHASDLRRWDSPVADLYRVERIPANFLIGPGGRILGTDLFGEELMTKLAELLKTE